MTVLLVLFTLILFLIFDHFVQRYRTRPVLSVGERNVRASVPMQFPIHVPEGVSLATNHTWMRRNDDGTVTIGFDEFLSRLMGLVEKISLPRAGEVVQPNFADVAVKAQTRTLRLAPPVIGNVVVTNEDVLRSPSLILSDPYGKGWLLRVSSGAYALEESRQFIVNRPAEWLREQAALVRDFIVMNSQQGQMATLQEGGLPINGVLHQFDESVWKDFSRSFVTLHRAKETESREIES